mgnify:CR=1 FL=1
MNNELTNNNTNYIRERGNDRFIVATNDERSFKILAEKGYIKEINDILLTLDRDTQLWTVSNAKYCYLVIPNNIQRRLWVLLRKKKGMFGKEKPTSKKMQNTFEINNDQLLSFVQQIVNNNLSFKEVYNLTKVYMDLPEYSLPDKGE